MTKGPRITLQTIKVLQCFREHMPDELAGRDIGKATGISSGTLYPLLVRLDHAGWLTSRWEEIDPHEAQRPRRRYRRLTDEGIRNADRLFAGLKEAES